MKGYLIAAATIAALTTQAQLAGPNRPGPGNSPGTFQTPGATASSIEQTTSPSDPTTVISPDNSKNFPRTGPVPLTNLGSPDATGGALSDSLRDRSSLSVHENWEKGAVGGEDRSRRLTPIGDASVPTTINGQLRSTNLSTSIPTPEPPMKSDLNTTGVNTPPRAEEKPLDKALTAKIRANLSQTPADRQAAVKISPETVRDMRITSQNGKVTLEGMVANKAEKDAIEIRAKEVQGVTRIDNELKVRAQDIGAPGQTETGHSSSKSDTQTKTDDAAKTGDSHPEVSPDR